MGIFLLDGRRAGRIALKGAATLAMLYILTPLFFVTWLSFYSQEIPSYPPEGYSLKWYRSVLDNDRFISGFVLSAQLGVMATLIGLGLGVPAALAIARLRFQGREMLNSLLLMPLTVPGVVLGLSMFVFHIETEIATGVSLRGSFLGLLTGHVLIVIPWIVRLVTASLAGSDLSLEEAAQSLGADRWTTFRRVTLPSILPGIVAATLFSFVVSFGNLEMTLFLIGPGSTTLPIAILQELLWKIDPTIAAVSVMQILLIGSAMLLTDRFVKISRVV